MKILQVIPSIAPGFGGPSQAAIGISASLSRLGHEVVIYTTNADTHGVMDVPLYTPVRRDGFTAYYFPVRFLKGYKFSPGLARALKKSIPDFDLVHIHSLFQFSTLAASFYCRKLGKPYIMRPLGHLDPYSLRHHGLLKKIYFELFERSALDHAARIHFTSEDEMHLARVLRLKAQPLVQGLGLNLDEYRSLPAFGAFREKYPQTKGKKIILFLSRINFKKGLDLMVAACKELCRHRQDLFLVIAGPDDGYQSKVAGWCADAGLIDRVLFTGMLQGREKLAAFRDADVFVLPSYSENFGISVAEAMASGLSVVVSTHVGLHAQISAAGAGIVIEPNAQALADALGRLMDDQALRDRMAAQARALAMGAFGWEHVAGSLAAVYGNILGAQSP